MAVEVGERGLLARQQGEDPAQHQVFEHIGVVAGMEGVAVVHLILLESGAVYLSALPNAGPA